MLSAIKVGSAYRSISNNTFSFIVLRCEEEKGFFDYCVVMLIVGDKFPKITYYLDDFLEKFEEIC
jgi:hypothetical protein